MKKIMKALAIALVASLVLSATPVIQVKAASGLNVEMRTKDQILSYISAHGMTKSAQKSNAVSYAVKNDGTAPYTNIGEISPATKQNFLDMINTVRYIAGIDYNVGWDAGYERLVQASAVVNGANGNLSHTPAQPAGMDPAIYQAGYEGSGKSNIYLSYGMTVSPWFTVVDSWMRDDDAGNRQTVGHRRWILNPRMGKTAYGVAEVGGMTSASMYAFDTSNSAGQSKVAWPAQNTPVEYFAAGVPWSLSVGQTINAGAVSVTITNRNTGETWGFGNAGSSGYFNVNNQGYGQKGCIIFVPESIRSYNDGDSYDVSVMTGSEEIAYTVNFFASESGNSNTRPQTTTPVTTTNTNTGNNTNLNQNTNTTQNTNTNTNTNTTGNTSTAGLPIHRLYNPNTGEHFFTVNTTEKNAYVRAGWKSEGSPSNSVSPSAGTALYRMYNPNNGDHHYSTSAIERDAVIKAGWKDEGIAYYVLKSNGNPVYRMYNPNNSGAGSHHYTTSAEERNMLVSLGWKYEGIPWYE